MRACVHSIIDSLDELIITYQSSSDKTEFIVKELAAAYPRKIRAYFYAPYVPPHTYYMRDTVLSNEYPQTRNIHNPANYYNYGYVKISYKYYMKVDADQIYFPEKMTDLRALLQKFQPCSSCVNISFFTKVKHKLARRVMKMISGVSCQMLVARLLHLPVGLALGGVNLSVRQDELCMPVKKGAPLPFNGLVGDTVAWAPAGHEKYVWQTDACCEIMQYRGHSICFGFSWLHLGPLKNNENFDHCAQNEYVLLSDLPKASKRILICKYKILKILPEIYQKAFKQFWQKDRLRITQSSINLCQNSIQFFSSRIEQKKKY